MGKLNLWRGVQAMQAAEDSQEELMANRNAESEFARRELWGEETKAAGKKKEGRSMRQTILGDNISTGTDLAKLALGMGILATGIGLPIGGYFVAEGLKGMKPDVVNNVTKDAKDTDTMIQLDLPK